MNSVILAFIQRLNAIWRCKRFALHASFWLRWERLSGSSSHFPAR